LDALPELTAAPYPQQAAAVADALVSYLRAVAAVPSLASNDYFTRFIKGEDRGCDDAMDEGDGFDHNPTVVRGVAASPLDATTNAAKTRVSPAGKGKVRTTNAVRVTVLPSDSVASPTVPSSTAALAAASGAVVARATRFALAPYEPDVVYDAHPELCDVDVDVEPAAADAKLGAADDDFWRGVRGFTYVPGYSSVTATPCSSPCAATGAWEKRCPLPVDMDAMSELECRWYSDDVCVQQLRPPASSPVGEGPVGPRGDRLPTPRSFARLINAALFAAADVSDDDGNPQ
jgi:hypothetical protein